MRRNIKIDRFWDLFVTADDFTTDLARVAAKSKTLRHVQTNANKVAARFVERKDLLLAPVPKDQEEGLKQLLDNGTAGYALSAVTIGQLKQAIADPSKLLADPVAQSLIRWINDPKISGKLRVNVHGWGASDVSVCGSDSKVRSVNAGAIIAWLIANGLTGSMQGETPLKRLVRITMRTCLAARFGQSAGSDGRVHPSSVLGQMKAKLQERGIGGIELVGLNELAAGGGSRLRRFIGMPAGDDWGPILVGQSRDKGKYSYAVTKLPSGPSFAFTEKHLELKDFAVEFDTKGDADVFNPKPAAAASAKKFSLSRLSVGM